MSSFYLYEGRHGERILTEVSRAAWDFLIGQLEYDDRMTIEESIAQGFDVSGSYEEGYISADDGGQITTLELTEVRE